MLADRAGGLGEQCADTAEQGAGEPLAPCSVGADVRVWCTSVLYSGRGGLEGAGRYECVMARPGFQTAESRDSAPCFPPEEARNLP